jgi:hypothetical protein
MRRALLITLLALVAAPASALASPEALYQDCQDGRIDKRYSQKDYRDALADIPGDLDEYSNCRELIRRAQVGSATTPSSGAGADTGGAAGGGGGPAAGAAAPPAIGRNDPAADPLLRSTLEERGAVADARGAPTFRPDGAGARPAGDYGSDLPTGLIALLVALALAGCAMAAPRLLSMVRRPSPA